MLARSWWLRYLTAAGLVVVPGLCVGYAAYAFARSLPPVVFLGTVAVSAWWLGLGPSLVTTVLSALAVDYFFVPPIYSIEFNEEHIVRLVTFVGVSVLISVLNQSLMRARERAEASAQAASRELAERRRIEEELRRANQVKDTFLATLSHELRTPLTAILGWSQMLKSGRLDSAGVRQAIESIDRSARVQSALVNDVLDVSRIVRGKLSLSPQHVRLVRVLGAALDTIQPAADAKGVELQRDFGCDPAVYADPDRLQQVFWNLLSNATRFTDRGGTVRVTLASAGPDVEVRVQDTGAGISADFLPHVFDSFSQGDVADARAHTGLGLGLAIVRSLVELHGGAVSASSDGPGLGAVFTVRLPAARPSSSGEEASRAAAAEAGESPARPLCGLRVLVVDDDADVREVIERILVQSGASVVTAESGAAALALLPGSRWDVLLSDLAMPGMDGYELIARLRALPAEQARTPALALTAHGREDDRVRALSAGFQQHAAKPIEPESLVRLVLSLTRAAGHHAPA